MKIFNNKKINKNKKCHFSRKMFAKLVEIGCVKQGHILLKSGQISNTYMDLRILTQYPKLLNDVCYLMYEKSKVLFDKENTCLIGVPMGGIHLATILSQFSNIPQVLVRKEPKNHGSKKTIENSLSFQNVILVEDVLTTGSSVKEMIELLSIHSTFKVCGVVCILNRSNLTHVNVDIPIYQLFNQFSLL
jgi:orotate phosphoribosyltransferase